MGPKRGSQIVLARGLALAAALIYMLPCCHAACHIPIVYTESDNAPARKTGSGHARLPIFYVHMGG